MNLEFLKSFSKPPEIQQTRVRRRRLLGFLVDGSTSTDASAIGDIVSKARRFSEGLELAKNVFLANDVFVAQGEIATIVFNDQVEAHPFIDVPSWSVPHITPQGDTRLGKALNDLLDMVEQHLVQLNAAGVEFLTPYAVLISDGQPNGERQRYLDDAVERARQAEASGAIEFICIGVDETDRGHLARLNFKNPPLIVSDTSWEEVFHWVSVNVSTGAGGQRPISRRSTSMRE